MGPSLLPCPSSKVMKSTPSRLNAGEPRIFGTSRASQASPLRIESLEAHPLLSCMSLHRFGVMKL